MLLFLVDPAGTPSLVTLRCIMQMHATELRRLNMQPVPDEHSKEEPTAAAASTSRLKQDHGLAS